MAQPIKIIVTICASAVLCVLLLSFFNSSPDYYSQPFTRVLRNDLIHKLKIIPVSQESYAAGFIGDQIYTGTYGKATSLKVSGIHSMLTDSFTINIIQPLSSSAYLQIDSPFVYVKDPKLFRIFKGTIESGSFSKVATPLIPFIEAIAIDTNSFIVRAINGLNENTLVKLSTREPYLRLAEPALEKQGEGLYSTAGQLHYSKSLQRIVYVYYFRNEFLLFDTALHLTASGRTIDTISRAQLKSLSLSDQTVTLSAPPLQVNPHSYVYEHYLFVHSSLMGVGENREDFDQHSAIDIYDLVTRKYIGSFYIPNHQGEALISFKLNNTVLAVVYPKAIILYHLNFRMLLNYFNQTPSRRVTKIFYRPVERCPFLVEKNGDHS